MWVLLVKSDGVRCARFCVSGVSTTATLIEPPPFGAAGLWSSRPHPARAVITSPRTTAMLRTPTRQVCSFAAAGERCLSPPAELAAPQRARSRGCFVRGDELQRDHRAIVRVTAVLPVADDAVDVSHEL